MNRTILRSLRIGGVVAIVAAGAHADGRRSALVSATYLGGTRDDIAGTIKAGPDGMLWIAGGSASQDFELVAPRADLGLGIVDALVLRVDPATRRVVSTVWLGGRGHDVVFDLAFAPDGTAFVTGTTSSPDFPSTGSGGENPLSGDQSVFVARLGPGGIGVAWAVVLRGSAADEGRAICVTSNGDPVVTGLTRSDDFPAVGAIGVGAAQNQQEAFVTRLAGADGRILFSAGAGTPDIDEGIAVTELSSGSIVVSGRTLLGAFTGGGPSWSGFLTEIAPDGGSVVRSRTLGTTYVTSIAAEEGGGFLAAGISEDTALPLARPRHRTEDHFQDAFVARFDAAWKVTGGSFHGGTAEEHQPSVARAADGRIWLTGQTLSFDLEGESPAPQFPSDRFDGFVAEFGADFRMRSGSRFGGTYGDDLREHVAVTPDGHAWILSMTWSDDFPQLDPVASAAFLVSGSDLVLSRYAPAAPPLPPAVPAAFAAAATSAKSVRLTWQTGGGLVHGHGIDRADFDRFERVATLPAGTTEWTDTTALPDRGYTYTVRALSAYGDSALSHDVRVVTPATIEPAISAGTFRISRRSRPSRLVLAGTIVATDGAAPPDLRQEGLAIDFFSATTTTLLEVAARAKGWRRSGRFVSYRTPVVKFDWDRATGAFRLSSKLADQAAPGAAYSLRVTSGANAGSASGTWRRVSEFEFRTP